MTGHSLGGTVVQHIAIHNPENATTAFNPVLILFVKRKMRSGKTYEYTNCND